MTIFNGSAVALVLPMHEDGVLILKDLKNKYKE